MMTDEEFDELFNPSKSKETSLYDISETNSIENSLFKLRHKIRQRLNIIFE